MKVYALSLSEYRISFGDIDWVLCWHCHKSKCWLQVFIFLNVDFLKFSFFFKDILDICSWLYLLLYPMDSYLNLHTWQLSSLSFTLIPWVKLVLCVWSNLFSVKKKKKDKPEICHDFFFFFLLFSQIYTWALYMMQVNIMRSGVWGLSWFDLLYYNLKKNKTY